MRIPVPEKPVEIFEEEVDVVELTLKDGSKHLCRGGEEAVQRAWKNYSVVSARKTGEKNILRTIPDNSNYDELSKYVPIKDQKS